MVIDDSLGPCQKCFRKLLGVEGNKGEPNPLKKIPIPIVVKKKRFTFAKVSEYSFGGDQIVPSLFIENFQMEIAEEIRKIAEEKLTGPSQFVVDVIVSSKRGPQKVMIIIDGDNGVNIDDCAKLSRELSTVLDESPLLHESYMLEVSTPGLDQPLKLKRQYKKNIGRKLKVKLQDKIVEGKLLDVTEEKITVEQEIGTGKKKELIPIGIQFSEIDKSFVLVSFK